MNDLLTSALNYANLGWKVFPLAEGTKKTLKDSHGFLDATTDENQIQTWWQFSNYNIGIACGNSGFIVLDLDRHDVDGVGNFLKLPGYQELPKTVSAITGDVEQPEKCGFHYLFKLPEGEKLRGNLNHCFNKQKCGIDIKNKGFIVVEPSQRKDGKSYKWLDGRSPWDVEIADLPAWLAVLIVIPEAEKKTKNDAPIPWVDLGDSDSDADEICDALNVIPSDDYDHWIKIGMAIKSAGLPCIIWDNWSQKSAKYEPGQCEKRWDGLSSNSVTKATIFGFAKEHGWSKSEYLRRTGVKQKPLVRKLRRVDEISSMSNTENGGEKTSEKKSKVNRTADTQLWLARKTIESYGDGGLIHNQGRFFQWNGMHWEPSDNEEIEKKVVKTAETLNKTSAPDDQIKISVTMMNAAVKFMRSQSHISDVIFDEPTDAISCQDGELFLVGDQWELRPHRKESYKLGVLPHKYDPAVTAPRFSRFLDEIFEGDEDACEKKECLLQYLGYCLTVDNRYKKFMMLYGPNKGNNGKSKICSVAVNLVGKKNYSAIDPGKIGERFQSATLFGKFVNIVPESPEGGHINDSQIKKITGGDPIQGEFKGRDSFSFVPYCKFLLGANSLPHCRDASNAFFSRAIIIKFNRNFMAIDDDRRSPGDPIPDENLEADLTAESQGIFNMALSALARLRLAGKFAEPKSSRSEVNLWQKDVDQVAQFVEDVCKVGKDAKGKAYSVSFRLLYSKYEEWAKDSGHDLKFTRNKFGRRLTNLGYPIVPGTANEKMRNLIDIDYEKLN